jgi:hypothetical protein
VALPRSRRRSSSARAVGTACAIALAGGIVASCSAGSASAGGSGTRGPAAGTPAPATAAPAPQSPAARAAAPLYPLPAPAISPTGCPIRPAPPGYGVIPRPPRPRVAESAVPAPLAQPVRRVDTSPIAGTGIWVTVFRGGHIDAPAIVDHAAKAHLHSIWVRTGSTHDGLYAASVLADLLPMAHAKHLAVIAWDFPTLSDPAADAARMVATLGVTVAGQHLDGVSPDVETSSEGVFLTGRRVASYFSRISAHAGSRPVIATVLRPTDGNWFSSVGYPYRAEAPYVDAFAPMVYWSCTEPGAATQQAVDRLRSLGRPVHTVGQAYDQGTYGRRGTPTPLETWRFLDVSKRRGAVGASLYFYDGMRGFTWRAIGAYPYAGQK